VSQLRFADELLMFRPMAFLLYQIHQGQNPSIDEHVSTQVNGRWQWGRPGPFAAADRIPQGGFGWSAVELL